MAIGKRTKATREGIDPAKAYPLAEAVQMIKERAKAKFDETIEIAMNLGVDPKHADQMVRGVVTLPNGTGRSVRVGVFGRPGEDPGAGANVMRRRGPIPRRSTQTASTSTIAKPDLLGKVGRLGKVLTPRPKAQSARRHRCVTMDGANAVKGRQRGLSRVPG
jgi:large subunit ribosomal protein L1